jgi:hypothetical protein
MRLRFKVIEIGWETDWDDHRHPRIRIGRRDWSAVLYDHPSEGWQVIALEIVRKEKRGARIEEHAGIAAETQLRKYIEGDLTFADAVLQSITRDLHELGRTGATKHWGGKTITLNVHPAKGN